MNKEFCFDQKDKVYLVTGASSGIGKSCCEELLKLNADVVGIDLNNSSTDHPKYRHFTADVADEASVSEAAAKVSEIYGRVDGLVNAAGVFASGKPFYELSSDEWNKVISVNLTGTFLMSKYVSGELIRNNRGKIVNICCIRSSIFKRNMADYAASKGGILSLTSAMALDLAPYNIQVNAVAPGFIYTGMTSANFDQPEIREQSEGMIPAGRIGMPGDISSVVMFLLSEMSDYITGTTIFADGGYRLEK